MSKLLIIDDNKKICETLSRNFRDEGFDCHTANNTKDALDIIQSCPIDLALIDVCIGDESGVNTLKQIQILQPDTPSIMITGFATV